MHWADHCEIKQLRLKIRELESTSASTWRKPFHAHSVEKKSPPPNQMETDANLAEVFNIRAGEVKQRQGVNNDWFFDSGASAHVTGNRDLLTDIRVPPNSTITIVGGKLLPVIGQDTAIIDNNKSVSRVLYVPGMIKNLLLVEKLADEGYLTLFGPKHCWVFARSNPRKLLLPGSRSHDSSLY
jgi:hypothetical protein